MDNQEVTQDKPKNNSRTLTTAIILLIIFVLILILFLYLVRRPAIFGSFAGTVSDQTYITPTPKAITPQSVSLDNSYIFASPLKAAVSVERVRITVYVLDGQGMGIAGKTVVLGNTTSPISVNPISPVTDFTGRATFDITSSQAGLFTIEALVDGKKLDQKVTVNFE
jgi:ABC-type uncharacterized transport system permease subunit